MADVGFVLFLVAFFAVAAGFVVACDRIIGGPDQAEVAETQPAETLAVEAETAEDLVA